MHNNSASCGHNVIIRYLRILISKAVLSRILIVKAWTKTCKYVSENMELLVFTFHQQWPYRKFPGGSQSLFGPRFWPGLRAGRGQCTLPSPETFCNLQKKSVHHPSLESLKREQMSCTLFSQRCSRPSVSLPNTKSFKGNKNENLEVWHIFAVLPLLLLLNLILILIWFVSLGQKDLLKRDINSRLRGRKKTLSVELSTVGLSGLNPTNWGTGCGEWSILLYFVLPTNSIGTPTSPVGWVELWDVESLCTAQTLAAVRFLDIVFWQTFCSVLGWSWGSVWKAGSSDVSTPPSERSWGGTPPAGSSPHHEPWLQRASCQEALQSPPQVGLTWKAVITQTDFNKSF